MTACQAPLREPTKANPGGDCRNTPAVRAAPLGATGRWVPLCRSCCGRYETTIPLSEVPES